MKNDPVSKSFWPGIVRFWVIFFVVMVLVIIALGPICPPDCGKRGPMSNAMQIARSIAFCLNSYAQDHNGKYPDGRTSTEIFQQLIDGKYVNDGGLFYVPLTGKVAAKTDKLKPENVSFDVTCCIDSTAPEQLPVVFLTGYKITYHAGASAVPVKQSIDAALRTWKEWWDGVDMGEPQYIAVSYYSKSARAIKADDAGSIPNFIPADFDPKGKTYRQLTP